MGGEKVTQDSNFVSVRYDSHKVMPTLEILVKLSYSRGI